MRWFCVLLSFEQNKANSLTICRDRTDRRQHCYRENLKIWNQMKSVTKYSRLNNKPCASAKKWKTRIYHCRRRTCLYNWPSGRRDASLVHAEIKVALFVSNCFNGTTAKSRATNGRISGAQISERWRNADRCRHRATTNDVNHDASDYWRCSFGSFRSLVRAWFAIVRRSLFRHPAHFASAENFMYVLYGNEWFSVTSRPWYFVCFLIRTCRKINSNLLVLNCAG